MPLPNFSTNISFNFTRMKFRWRGGVWRLFFAEFKLFRISAPKFPVTFWRQLLNSRIDTNNDNITLYICLSLKGIGIYFCVLSTIKICKSFEKWQIVQNPNFSTNLKTPTGQKVWVENEYKSGEKRTYGSPVLVAISAPPRDKQRTGFHLLARADRLQRILV
jgi:hypothetical protein